MPRTCREPSVREKWATKCVAPSPLVGPPRVVRSYLRGELANSPGRHVSLSYKNRDGRRVAFSINEDATRLYIHLHTYLSFLFRRCEEQLGPSDRELKSSFFIRKYSRAGKNESICIPFDRTIPEVEEIEGGSICRVLRCLLIDTRPAAESAFC